MAKKALKTTPIAGGGYFDGSAGLTIDTERSRSVDYSTSLIERLRRFRCLNVSPKSFGLSERIFKGFELKNTEEALSAA